MRSSRLLSTLLLLQARGRMTATELAAELEVSVRTVYRDIEALSASGVPVYADRGVTGGYQLVDGYSTKLTGLTESEAHSLLFSGIPGAATELGLGEVLAAAELKLSAAMPVGLRGRTDHVRKRFLLDPHGWFRPADKVPQLLAIAAAVWDEHRIHIRYQRWGGELVSRTLNPLGIVLKTGNWYLVATARDNQPRMYRISRVHRLRTLDQAFTRPADFDLRDYWNTRNEELSAALHHGTALVRLSPRARRMLYLLSLSDNDISTIQGRPPGWITVEIPIESIENALAQFLQFGSGCEIIEPAELRDRVRAELTAMSDLYSPTSTTPRHEG